MARQVFLGHGLVERHALRRTLAQQRVGGLHDVPAATVVGTDGERHAGIAGRACLGVGNHLLQAGFETRQVADDAQPDAIAMQLRDLTLQGRQEEPHQQRDFLGRTTPVLGTEGEEREELDPPPGAPFDRGTYGLDPLAVTGSAWQMPACGPAAIAIENDGDVARDGSGGRNGLRRTGEAHDRRSGSALGQRLRPS